MPYQITPINTIFFLLLFVLALFPSIFNWLLYLPLLPFTTSPKPTYNPTASQQCTYSTDPALVARLAVLESAFQRKNTMSWSQKQFTLPTKSRGAYLITDEVLKQVPEIKDYKVGLLHLFVQHTSCALSLNENWDSDVREDMSNALDRIAPEDHKGTMYSHSCEGPDDMPAHIKSALVGASVTVPISNGKLATGTWQGIWYLEFRASKHSRHVVATIQGEKK